MTDGLDLLFGAYFLAGVAAGFLLNAIFGPRRVHRVLEVRTVEVQAARKPSAPRKATKPGAKVKAKA